MKLLGLLGASLKHSFSPALMNGLAHDKNLPLAYFPFEVPEVRLPQFIEAVRLLPISGFNVTIPHKEAILPFLDEQSPEVQAIGAANTVLNREGKLIGFNTDTAGFLSAVQRLFESKEHPQSALILGAGGAARAVLFALLSSGTQTVFVVNRNEARAHSLKDALRPRFPQKEILAGPLSEDFLRKALGQAELIVQTTSVGMWPREKEMLPFPFEALQPSHKIMDLIYNPVQTRFLQEATKRRLKVLNGLPMLVGQAAKSLEIWGFLGQEKHLEKLANELQKEP